MKSRSAVACLLMALFVSASGLCVNGFGPQPTQKKEGTFFHFQVFLKRMELEGIEAYIEILFNDFPFEAQSITVSVERPQLFMFSPGKIDLQPDEFNRRVYRGNMTIFFYPEGSTELYPMDAYLLDFNITVYVRVPEKMGVPRSFIDQNNSWVGFRCLIPGLDEVEERGASFGVSSITYDMKGVHIYSRVYLQRWFSSQLIMSVLIISYLLLGSLLLIRPDKLEQRLSVCLTLFMFAISFTFTIDPPPVYQARATLGETLTFFLLMGAGLLSVLSVIERTVFEAKPKLEILQYPIEGSVLSLLSFALYSQLAYYAGLVRPYPTAQYHPLISVIFFTAILYGYLAKTILFLAIRIRKH